MAIDLEGIMNRIMNMAEQKQKDMPSGLQVYNDAQTQHKNDAIDKVNIARDQFASNERAAQLAHPASSLDFRGREAYANAAIGKMNAEAEHYKGTGIQATGTGNYYNQFAEKEKAIASMLPSLNTNQQQNYLMGRPIPPKSENINSSVLSSLLPNALKTTSAEQYKLQPRPLDTTDYEVQNKSYLQPTPAAPTKAGWSGIGNSLYNWATTEGDPWGRTKKNIANP